MSESHKYHSAKVWQIGLFTLNNTATNISFVLVLFYAFYTQNVLGLAAATVGLIATIMRIFDGVTDPIIGFAIDRTDGKFGKFRPYMLSGNIIMFIAILLLFTTDPTGSSTFKYVYTAAMYALYVIGYTFQTACTKSAQAALTDDPKQRPLFTLFDAIYNAILFNVSIWFITSYMGPQYAENINDPALWRDVSLILMGISFVFPLPAIIGIWEKDRTQFFGLGLHAPKIRFKDTLDVIKHNKNLQMLIVAASTDKLANVAVRGALVYFFSNMLLSAALQGTYSLWTIAPTLLVTYIGVKFAASGGLKKSFVLFTWLGAVMLVVMIVATPLLRADSSQIVPFSVILLLVLMAIQVSFSALAGNIVIPMIADCNDYETYRSGRYMPGMVGTIFSFVDKLISSLSTLVVGLALTLSGYGSVQIQPNTQLNASFDIAIMVIIFALPLFGHIASLMSMKYYDLTDKKMEEIKDTIRQRRIELHVEDGIALEAVPAAV
ncbi:MAG TPA: MFS transporter [Anaerolineae bacterium]|nr:MFS transporter [Anaerolineae bacterium]